MSTLHHVKIRSKNALLTAKKLIRNFDFEPIAFRKNEDVLQIVITAGQTIFVVTEVKRKDDQLDHVQFTRGHHPGIQPDDIERNCVLSMSGHVLENGDGNTANGKVNRDQIRRQDHVKPPYIPPYNESELSIFDEVCYCVNNTLSCDETVYDVAFEVKNMEKFVMKCDAHDVEVICPPRHFHNDEGGISVTVIKSCVGNVFHTVICKSQYSGLFLPGYCPITDLNVEFEELAQDSIHHHYDFADHVTYAVHRGTSAGILSWYETIFGMKRFFLNSDDSLESGFVIQGQDVGLRLYALNFWKCAEVGLRSDDSQLTLVLAESLEGQGPNQVDTFLREHGCAGVQHIGLSTASIYTVMDKLTRNGVNFMIPPPTYYTKVGKADEIESVGEDVTMLQKFGILLDSEADRDHSEQRFLMQVFTAPLFRTDTFFLEIIQRKGARGFGAGNIKALWKSMEVYLKEKS